MAFRVPYGFQVRRIVSDKDGFNAREVKVDSKTLCAISSPSHQGEMCADEFINSTGLAPRHSSEFMASLRRIYEGKDIRQPYDGYVPPSR